MSAGKSDVDSSLMGNTGDRELIVSRAIAAPRAIVFKAFGDRDNISLWWGPNGFRTTTYEMDVRPGGVWRYTMHGPDGVDWPNKVVYIEVVEGERLVYHHGTDGDVANDPHSFHVTITFSEQDGKTIVTSRSLFSSKEQLDQVKQFGAVEGGKQTLARLDQYITRLAR
jgi:uncharacterized protein YndB with AHSA1/START domain